MTLIAVFGKRKWNWPRGISPAGRSRRAAAREPARTGSRTSGSARAGRRRARRRPPRRSPGARPGSGSTRGSSRSTPSSSRRTRPRPGDGTEARRRRGRRRRVARAARRASLEWRASASGFTNTNGPHVSTASGKRPIPSRSNPGSGRCAARRGASRRARTSRRGRGTGASPAVPRPRRGASPVAADVQERPQLAAAVAHDYGGDVACPGRHEPAGLGDLVGPRRVLPEAAEDRAPARAGGRPGPRTSSRAASAPRPSRPRQSPLKP